MESFIRRKVGKQLSKYFKNFDPKQFKIGLLNGQSALENLEFNEDIVGELLGLRHVIVESCTISALRIQLSLTALTSEPIQITIEKLHLKIREKSPAEWLNHPHRFPIAQAKVEKAEVERKKSGEKEKTSGSSDEGTSFPVSAPSSSQEPGTVKTEELPPELVVDLKFKDKVIDGLHIRIEEFLFESQNLPVGGVMPPRFCMELQGLNLYTTNAEWQVVELRNARSFNKGRSARFVFKVLFVRSFSLYFSSASQSGQPMFLVPRETSLKAHVTIRKNLENKLTGLQFDLQIATWNQTFSFELIVHFLLFVRGFLACLKRKDQKAVVKRSKPKVAKPKTKGPKPQILVNFLINEIAATLPRSLSDADLASVDSLDLASIGSQRHSAPPQSSRPSSAAGPSSLPRPSPPEPCQNEEPMCLHIDDFQLRVQLLNQPPSNDKLIEIILTSIRLEDRNSSTSRVLERIRTSDDYGHRQRARRQRFQQRKRRFNLKPGVFTPWLLAPDINLQASGTRADQVMSITGKAHGGAPSSSGKVVEDAIARSHAVRKEGWVNPEEFFELKHPRTFHPLVDSSSRRLPLLHLCVTLCKQPTGEEQMQEQRFNPDSPLYSRKMFFLINPIRLSLTPLSIKHLVRLLDSYQYSIKLEAYLQCMLQAIPQPSAPHSAKPSPLGPVRSGVKTTSSEPALGPSSSSPKKTGAAFQRQLTLIRVHAPSVSLSLWSVTDSPTILALKLSDIGLTIKPQFGKNTLAPACLAIPRCNFFQANSMSRISSNDFSGIMQLMSLSLACNVDILHSSPGQTLLHDHVVQVPSVLLQALTSQPDQQSPSPSVFTFINAKIPSVNFWLEDHQYFAAMGIVQELKSALSKSNKSAGVASASRQGSSPGADQQLARKADREAKKSEKRQQKAVRKSSRASKKDSKSLLKAEKSKAKPPKGPQRTIVLLNLSKLTAGIVGCAAQISSKGVAEAFEGNALPVSLAEFELNTMELLFETHKPGGATPDLTTSKTVAQLYIKAFDLSAPTIRGRESLVSTSTAPDTQFLCVDFAQTSVKKHVSVSLDGLQVTLNLEHLAQVILFFFEPLQHSASPKAAEPPSPRSVASSRMTQSTPTLPNTSASGSSNIVSSSSPGRTRPSSHLATGVPAKPQLQFEISLRDWGVVLFPLAKDQEQGRPPSKEFLPAPDQNTRLVCSIASANFIRSTQPKAMGEMMILFSLGGLSTSLVVKGLNPVAICHPVDLKTNLSLYAGDEGLGKRKSWQVRFQMDQLNIGLDTSQMQMLKDLISQLLRMKK
ncbi:MAG: hypothetical protein Q8P67_01625, partial [archaeon]|nr:hypothetical protein [archaeon]